MQNNGVDHLVNHPGILTAFSVVIIIMLLLDLGVFNKKAMSFRTRKRLSGQLYGFR